MQCETGTRAHRWPRAVVIAAVLTTTTAMAKPWKSCALRFRRYVPSRHVSTKDSCEATLRVVLVALGELIEETITKLEPMNLSSPTAELE